MNPPTSTRLGHGRLPLFVAAALLGAACSAAGQASDPAETTTDTDLDREPETSEPDSSEAQEDDTDYVARVFAGGFHSMELRGHQHSEVGRAFGFGHNLHGQLGLGSEQVAETVEAPAPLTQPTTWKALSLGALHSLGICEQGHLWGFGYNEYGQLGLGTFGQAADEPRPARISDRTDWKSVVAGGEHSLALRSDGTLWAFGYNNVGQLGTGDTQLIVDQPAQVGMDADWMAVDAGAYHTVAPKEDGSLYVWGSNDYAQLGLAGAPRKQPVRSPTKLEAQSSWAHIAAGGHHTLAVRSDGALFAWGRSDYGQAGAFRTENSPVLTPTQLGQDTDFEAVLAGYFYSLARRRDGTWWGWGDNQFGQLGEAPPPKAQRYETPTPIGSSRPYESCSAGFFHLLCAAEGELYAYGRNEFGQLGK